MEMLKKPNNPGLKKLPTKVRNKMGYAKDGGKVKAMYGAKMKKKAMYGAKMKKKAMFSKA